MHTLVQAQKHPATQSNSSHQVRIADPAIQKSRNIDPGEKAEVIDHEKNIGSGHNFSEIPVHAPTNIQAKLTVNQPNDVYEQEADAVADKIMRMPDMQTTRNGTLSMRNVSPKVQRKCAKCEEEEKKVQRKESGHTAPMPTDNVSKVLQSSGQPLDTSARVFMESRFGLDFGGVRVHHDEASGQSAHQLGARAYTVGRDIVFGAGQYAPATQPGRSLLAHELTHVVQQGATPASAQSGVTPGKTIQRSLFGGILGGIVGAAAGATIGGLLGGPIGAVVGGVVGLVAGAIIGDSATTKSRSLTGPEVAYAKDIFKDSIDYSKITITRDSIAAAGAPRTLGNTINLKSSWGHFKGDTLELTQYGLETLIHEMGHVWQYQNGGIAYIPESLIAQLKVTLSGKSRDAAYDWRAADKAKIPWEKWNPEQQAAAIEDYNKLLRKSKEGTASVTDLADLSTLLPYMENVWHRRGAPTFDIPPMDKAPI